MSKDTGGPAFPGLHPSKECRYSDEGMTLRDYFAAKAMHAEVVKWGSGNPEERARDAYRMADAMINVRASWLGE